jgi:hypothetical protein
MWHKGIDILTYVNEVSLTEEQMVYWLSWNKEKLRFDMLNEVQNEDLINLDVFVLISNLNKAVVITVGW